MEWNQFWLSSSTQATIPTHSKHFCVSFLSLIPLNCDTQSTPLKYWRLTLDNLITAQVRVSGEYQRTHRITNSSSSESARVILCENFNYIIIFSRNSSSIRHGLLSVVGRASKRTEHESTQSGERKKKNFIDREPLYYS